ncbi:MAG: Plug domain-containing protein, partial [Gammaproteobacteria bacterium]|nr:Plug domain-containing protein [Gammaproteobacteria bacterium]
MSEKQIIKSRMALPLNPVAGAVALAIGSMTLASTDVHASGGYINDEMVVTSTKRDSSVQDVPFNVSAFSGEILEEQRITDLNQLARWVPGLTVTNQGQRSANVLTARGLNASSIQASELLGNSGGGTVQTYLGDVPVYVDLQMLDIERVEVL